MCVCMQNSVSLDDLNCLLLLVPLTCVTSAANALTKMTSKHCDNNKYTNVYGTMESAKKACFALGDQCTGVYDNGCDGVGPHSLCKPGPFVGSMIGSCVYRKFHVAPGRSS